METEQRQFPHTDADMLAASSAYRLLATDHLAELEAFDPELNATFLNDWNAAIDAAIDLPTDESTMDVMQGFTNEVNTRHEACMEAMRDLRYYASKAFAKSGWQWAFLNFNALNKARHSTSRTVVYLMTVHRVATALSAPLLAKGMLPAQIDALQTTAQALLVADIDQEHHKHERLMLTRKRVQTMNLAWSFCQQVNRASKSVFADQPVLLQVFELPR